MEKHLVQGSRHWLEYRQKRIGGSDVASILGISPWRTAYQLYLEKVGPLIVKPPNPAQARGISLEGPARKWFYQQTGFEVFPVVREHPDYPFMIGSFDGITKDGQHAVEIKAPGKKDHDLALRGEIPSYYFCQLQHLLEVCGLDMMHYCSFDGSDGVIIEVERDNAFIDNMIEKELEFFKGMESLTPPALMDRDVVVRTDKEWAEACEEYRAIKTSLKYFEERETLIRDKLIRLADDRCSEGSGLRLTKYVRQGTVNYSLIPELKGVPVDVYRKPATTVWKIGEV